MIEEGNDVKIEGNIIKGDLNLRKAGLRKDKDDKVLVTSSIKIRRSEIQGVVDFRDVIFNDVNFEYVVFKEPICFDGSTFHSAKFQGAKFCKYAGFEDTVFSSYAQFSHAHFVGKASFTNIRFKGHARFEEAEFEEGAYFWSLKNGRTIFDCDAYFNNAKFHKNVTFHSAEFCSKADFQLTNFNGEHVQFLGVNFKDESDFKGAQFKGKALFRKAKFYGLANFQLAHFKEDAYFQDIMFIEGAQANFTETKFDGDVAFVRSLFSDSVTFIGTRFNGYLDFAYAKFNKDLILDLAKIRKMRFRAELGNDSNISLKDADFDQITNIRWDDIKEHLDYEKNGRTTYLSLVRSFKSIGFFDDADDCYYVCRDKMKNENKKFNWSKIYDILSYVSCGYGVRPDFTIICITGTIFIFGLLFWDITKITILLTMLLNIDVLIVGFMLGHITKFSNPELDLDRIFNHIYSNLLQNCNSLLDNLYLSLMIFIGQTPSKDLTGFLKFAAIVEGILGYLFLALFIVVLARKFIR